MASAIAGSGAAVAAVWLYDDGGHKLYSLAQAEKLEEYWQKLHGFADGGEIDGVEHKAKESLSPSFVEGDYLYDLNVMEQMNIKSKKTRCMCRWEIPLTQWQHIAAAEGALSALGPRYMGFLEYHWRRCRSPIHSSSYAAEPMGNPVKYFEGEKGTGGWKVKFFAAVTLDGADALEVASGKKLTRVTASVHAEKPKVERKASPSPKREVAEVRKTDSMASTPVAMSPEGTKTASASPVREAGRKRPRSSTPPDDEPLAKPSPKRDPVVAVPALMPAKVEPAVRLVFPSLSTAVFSFAIEKAAPVLASCLVSFLKKYDRVKHSHIRLSLIDIPDEGRMDSVTTRAIQKAYAAECKKSGIAPDDRFSVVIGDIADVKSRGECFAIANAANESFSGGPKTGGINRAIYVAAGWKELQEDSRSRYPEGAEVSKAYDVPLRSESPLYLEGVRHIIHIVGPNMNPSRPNCLHGDYEKGCVLLAASYFNMFTKFLQLADASS